MSRLRTTDYENVLDLIEAVSMTPTVSGVSRLGCTVTCGYTVTDIISSLRLNKPSNAMSDAQVVELLNRGARQGVFTKVCSNAIAPDVAECDDAGLGAPLFRVNQQMVARNQANKIYADAFNRTPVIEYDACATVNPYLDASTGIGSYNTGSMQSNYLC